MAISTYTQLKTALANWLVRSDQTDRIPEYIAMCEGELNRTLRSPRMANVDSALAITSGVAAVPTGFLAVLSFSLTSDPYNQIRRLPIDQIERLDPSNTDKPFYYDWVGSSLLCYPPTTATAKLRYRKALTAMSADADTNWVLTAYPDIFVYGSLRHADRRLVDQERLALWEEGYQRAILQLEQLENGFNQDAVYPQPSGFVV